MEAILSRLKSLLLKAWTHVLVKEKILLGCVHSIDNCSEKGLVWNTVTNGELSEITSLKDDEISSLTVHSLFKVIVKGGFTHRAVFHKV